MKYLESFFVVALAVMTFTACADESDTEVESDNMEQTESYESGDNMENDNMQNDSMEGDETIVSVASGNQNLSTLVKAVKSTGSVQMLSSEGPFTVFAPTNEAFNALPQGTLDNLMMAENKDKLRNILAYHVVEGTMMAADLKDGQTLTTAQGADLQVTKQNGNVMINGATVAKDDVQASNGVVHVVDTVLMPSNN